MRLPITAWASISHRITGVINFGAMLLLLWGLDVSLSSPEGFDAVAGVLGNPLVKLVLWGLVAALIYHALAGIKHIVMDFGVGETMEGGVLGARIVIGLTVVLVLLAGVAIW